MVLLGNGLSVFDQALVQADRKLETVSFVDLQMNFSNVVVKSAIEHMDSIDSRG